MRNIHNNILIFLILVAISACSWTEKKDSPPTKHIDISQIRDATPRLEPRSKSGNPASYVVRGERYYVMKSGANYQQRGLASWYGTKFHGRKTSSGEAYDMYKMTAAHKTLPIPTYVKVTNLENSKSIVVRVNDRGPFVEDRIIDLSYVAARKLDIYANGTGHVEVQAIDLSAPYSIIQTQAQPVASIGSRFYYLQVGAFHNIDNANNLMTEVNMQLERPVQVSIGNNSDGAIYRVRIGPFDNHDKIKAIESKLSDLGYKSTQVVADQQFVP